MVKILDMIDNGMKHNCSQKKNENGSADNIHSIYYKEANRQNRPHLLHTFDWIYTTSIYAINTYIQ